MPQAQAIHVQKVFHNVDGCGTSPSTRQHRHKPLLLVWKGQSDTFWSRRDSKRMIFIYVADHDWGSIHPIQSHPIPSQPIPSHLVSSSATQGWWFIQLLGSSRPSYFQAGMMIFLFQLWYVANWCCPMKMMKNHGPFTIMEVENGCF